MQAIGKKDNSTFHRKAALRSRALMLLTAPPVIMETHGGRGRIFDRCYRHVNEGAVIELDEDKSAVLAQQRPTWAVYQCDTVRGLAAGIGAHLAINFLDVDPYGEPWPTLEAFFGSHRPFADELVIVVNDGLRQKLRMNGGWTVGSLAEVVKREGNQGLYKNYLAICRDLMAQAGARAGYVLKLWSGYYCGHADQMTHYCAKLERV